VKRYGRVKSKSLIYAATRRPSEHTVHNEGSLALYDLKFYCRAYLISYKPGTSIQEGLSSSEPFNVPELTANEKTSTPCYVGYETPFPPETADIAVVVSYIPRFSLWRKENRFRFVATRDADGIYHWVEMADRPKSNSELPLEP
jgi:hypothetical protein